MPDNGLPVIKVVAAVLKDGQGRVLIAERPPGKPLAGFWEFPGGKLEPGEAAQTALVRELREELGLDVRQARPLLQLSHDYPERRVQLDVWRVTAWSGTPYAHENQAFAWVQPEELSAWRLLPADQPIVTALRLPPLMLVTPDPGGNEVVFLRRLERCLEAGVEFVQFRAPSLTTARYTRLAHEVVQACRKAGARVVLNAEPEVVHRLEADGVHLSSRYLRGYANRPLESGHLVGASCHSRDEMRMAVRCQADYLVLGPVLPTASHPGAAPIGWERFAELVRDSTVPVYAIGGLSPELLETARRHGSHGVAAVRALWDPPQESFSS